MSFRNFLLSFVLCCCSASAAFALEGGYYRVQNYATKRFCYIWDNTGKLDWAKTDADLGAIELFKTKNYSDPGGVIYVKPVGSSYDIQSQGTGVYKMIQYYVSLSDRGNGNYWVYASSKGVTKYLCDAATSTRDERGTMATATSSTGATYQLWHVLPISAETDEYFGITPTVTMGSRYFKPFYAAFPFQFYSSGMKAWYISKVDEKNGVAIISEYTGNVIPGEMPVILEASTANATTNRLSLLTEGGSAPADNQLTGCYFCNQYRLTSSNAKTEFNASTMRVLATNANGKLVYTNSTQTLKQINSKYYLNANESYLKVSSAAPAELVVMTQEEYDAAYPPKVNVSSITLNQTSANLYVGDNLQLQAVVSPDNATDASLTWSTSNAQVATVDANGKVSALAEGTARITVTANDGSGISASCDITITRKIVYVSSIVLNQTSANLYVGDNLQLQAVVSPDNATDATLTWSSSNAQVATVDANGWVSALAEGTARITVTANDGSGVSAACDISVQNGTGINAAKMSLQRNGMIYNLKGQPVRRTEDSTEGLPAGLYLVDGRLIFIP
ncbi:MAG: Ig domain-containing protein [Bacteroidales bacterium]|nr:Ig domain-containing protein [Bacteroidales bacterium]